jgi:hypothetical protein
MGIVDDHEEGLTRLDALEASRHRAHGSEGARDQGRIHPEGDAHAGRGQQILDIVLAHQRRRDVQMAGRRPHIHANALGAGRPARGAHVGTAADAVGQGVEGQVGDHGQSRWIVGIDHRRPLGLAPGHEESEEMSLGVTVGVHGHVKIEMILGQVREDGYVEVDALYPRQRQRVRGHFHGHGSDALVHHAPKQPLRLERLRGGLAGGHAESADAVLHGADETGASPLGGEQSVHEIGGRGLAVGARDPDHRQRSGRMPEVRVGEAGQRLARGGHEHASHASPLEQI